MRSARYTWKLSISGLHVEALRQDGLKNVSGRDVLLGPLHGGQEVGFLLVRYFTFSFVLAPLPAGSLGRGLRQALFELVEPLDGLFVGVRPAYRGSRRL